MNKRNSSARFEIIRTAVAVAIAMLAAVVIIFSVSEEPVNALYNFIIGPFTSLRRIGNVIEMACPFIFTALAVCVMFQANQFSMIAEGSFFFGALCAAVAAIKLPEITGLSPIIALLIGTVAGGILGAIPGFFKAKWKTDEFVISLMLNYVALYFSLYLMNLLIRDASAGSKVSEKFQDSFQLINLIPGTRVHMGVILSILMIIIVYVFLYHNRWGYQLRMAGCNIKFAQYSGINTFAVILGSQIIGGCIAGLGGAVEMLGIYNRFQWTSLPNYGFDGITVAIIAKKSPKLVPIAALFLAYLRIGADIMSRSSDVPSEVISVIQSLVIVLIAANSFLSGFRHRMLVKESMKKPMVEGGNEA